MSMSQDYQNGDPRSSYEFGAAVAAGHPTLAFVACNESASSVRQRLIDKGLSLTGRLILSALDNPQLNSLDAVTAALPESIKVLEIHNIECLLPADRRTAVEVMRLIDRIAKFVLNRGMTGTATSTVDVGSALADGSWL